MHTSAIGVIDLVGLASSGGDSRKRVKERAQIGVHPVLGRVIVLDGKGLPNAHADGVIGRVPRAAAGPGLDTKNHDIRIGGLRCRWRGGARCDGGALASEISARVGVFVVVSMLLGAAAAFGLAAAGFASQLLLGLFGVRLVFLGFFLFLLICRWFSLRRRCRATLLLGRRARGYEYGR